MQRFKEEELIAHQLHQHSDNALERMINNAVREADSVQEMNTSGGGAGTLLSENQAKRPASRHRTAVNDEGSAPDKST